MYSPSALQSISLMEQLAINVGSAARAVSCLHFPLFFGTKMKLYSLCRIKNTMLKALLSEREKSVRNLIVRTVGALIRNSESSDWVTHLLKPVIGQCNSTDPAQSEVSNSLFLDEPKIEK